MKAWILYNDDTEKLLTTTVYTDYSEAELEALASRCASIRILEIKI